MREFFIYTSLACAFAAVPARAELVQASVVQVLAVPVLPVLSVTDASAGKPVGLLDPGALAPQLSLPALPELSSLPALQLQDPSDVSMRVSEAGESLTAEKALPAQEGEVLPKIAAANGGVANALSGILSKAAQGLKRLREDGASAPVLLERLGELFSGSAVRKVGPAPASTEPGLPRPASVTDDQRALTQTDIVVLDMETSSFLVYPEVSRPIDIGAVKLRFLPDGSMKVLGTFSQKIDPRLPLDARVTAKTGITPGDLKGQPSIREVLPRLLEFIGKEGILVAHSAVYDSSFLAWQLHENGLPLPGHWVLDTFEMARKLWPGLKSYSVQNLLDVQGLGRDERHQGLSDAEDEVLLLGRLMNSFLKKKKAQLSEMKVSDLQFFPRIKSLSSVFKGLSPLPVPPGKSRPLPPHLDAKDFDRLDKKLYHEGRPNQLRDVAKELGVAYEELLPILKDLHAHIPVARTDELLAQVESSPKEVVFADYDNTLARRNAQGLSVPSPDVLLVIEEHLRRGIPVAIISSRNYDYQPPEAVSLDPNSSADMAIAKVLVERIEPRLRRHLVIVGSLGGELVLFDEKGEAVRVLHSQWAAQEKPLLKNAFAKAFADAGVSLEKKDAVFIHSNPSQMAAVFKPRETARAAQFAGFLQARMAEAKLPYPVLHNKNWVYVGKYTKETGARLAYAVLKSKGYPISPKNLLLLGDEFQMPEQGAMGGDASMALAFPDSLAVNVGEARWDFGGPSRGPEKDPMPKNVRRLGITGAPGSLRLLQSNLRGHDARRPR
ncbi:MAG: exonuclease domain-containing protein [Elusimicrobiota bacterium]